jgi:hypothetical protein
MATNDSNQKSHTEAANVSEVGSDPLSATVEYKRHPIYSPSEWLYESISSILALGLLVAIAIIFAYMDNKRLDAWNSRVSLNATISSAYLRCAFANRSRCPPIRCSSYSDDRRDARLGGVVTGLCGGTTASPGTPYHRRFASPSDCIRSSLLS